MMDRPLQAFHEHVNTAVRDGRRAVANFDHVRYLGYVQSFVARAKTQLTPANAASDAIGAPRVAQGR